MDFPSQHKNNKACGELLVLFYILEMLLLLMSQVPKEVEKFKLLKPTVGTFHEISLVVAISKAAAMYQCDITYLKRALVSRSISTGVGKRGSVINIPLDMNQVFFFFISFSM